MTNFLNQFKTNFSGGSRSNRFLISGNIPSGLGNSRFTDFHVRSTILPQAMSTTLTYDYFGRKFHYPGEKQYSAWSIAVIDDTPELYNTWKKFHTWQNKINQHTTNVSESFVNYKADGWTVQQLNLNGEADPSLKVFKMYGVWPRSIMDMPLNMANPNTINQFTVVLIYDYIELFVENTKITRDIT